MGSALDGVPGKTASPAPMALRRWIANERRHGSNACQSVRLGPLLNYSIQRVTAARGRVGSSTKGKFSRAPEPIQVREDGFYPIQFEFEIGMSFRFFF